MRSIRNRTPDVIRRAATRLLALCTILTIAACNQSAGSRDKLLVVTTFYPLYEFARHIAASTAQVISLVPAGTEPHDWEPSPQDLTLLRAARVFVYNGAGLEPWVPKFLLEAVGSALVTVRATDGIALLDAVPRAGDQS
ncbi:MAG: ABC transporter substrate-binding protein, partial [Candidatus Rokuibacteriota bacterium]